MVNVRLFAAAADAAGTDALAVNAASTGELCDALRTQFGAEFSQVLAQCSLLVAGTRVAPCVAGSDADVPLGANVTVDVLPPFAGG
ncbi:MoaD/ThiS family protein [Gulosibacter bifidus]|uniref:MoaD/ThiS family protein n=1 Tax=Gulosibacter bifidus TaxID=272239 RepID=A0ABW5RHX1_9MICO|nr:MoaD/ThiS family protein [Gulosibacter bifidus]